MKSEILKYLEKIGVKFKSSEKTKDYYSIDRYRKVPLHGIFLYTSEDELIEEYIKFNWGALDSLSGEFCDIHPTIEQFKSNEDAYDFINKLKVVSESKEEIITKLPGLFFWDINANGTFVSLSKIKTKNQLSEKIRLVFSEIRKKPKIANIKKTNTKVITKKPSFSWLVISVICGITSILFYKFLEHYPQYIDESIIGISIFIVILLANPKRRFYKAFWTSLTMLGSLTLIPALNLKSEVNIETLNGVEKKLFHLIVEEQHWIIYCVLGLIAVSSLILDYFERKEKSS